MLSNHAGNSQTQQIPKRNRRTGQHGHVDQLEPLPAESPVQKPRNQGQSEADYDAERDNEVWSTRAVYKYVVRDCGLHYNNPERRTDLLAQCTPKNSCHVLVSNNDESVSAIGAPFALYDWTCCPLHTRLPSLLSYRHSVRGAYSQKNERLPTRIVRSFLITVCMMTSAYTVSPT